MAGLWLCLGAVLPAFASPVDPAVSASYFSGWLGGIHYCRAGLCGKLGRRDMPQADRASFRPLSERYALDRQRVYYEGREIQGADPVTLRVLGPDHAADRESFYVKGYRIREADAASARHIPRHYVLDQNKVWYGEFETDRPNYYLKELTGADPKRFGLIDPDRDTLATDGQLLFMGSEALPLTLGKDFRLLESQSLLAFVSDARLHVLASGLPPSDLSAFRAAGAEQRNALLSLPGQPSMQGGGAWRLLNGRWLIAEQERRWRLLGGNVKRLTTFNESRWYAVADGVLWYASPRWELSAVEAGAAGADLRLLSAHYLVNNGQVIYQGRPVPGADAASFQIAPKGVFRFSIDAMDRQSLYGMGERVDANDDAGRQRHRMPR
jgi:hypothetical protein